MKTEDGIQIITTDTTAKTRMREEGLVFHYESKWVPVVGHARREVHAVVNPMLPGIMFYLDTDVALSLINPRSHKPEFAERLLPLKKNENVLCYVHYSNEAGRFNRTNVNSGYPQGTVATDMRPGRWVEVRWDDKPQSWALIVTVGPKPARGQPRSIEVLREVGKTRGRPGVMPTPIYEKEIIVHTQIAAHGNIIDDTWAT